MIKQAVGFLKFLVRAVVYKLDENAPIPIRVEFETEFNWAVVDIEVISRKARRMAIDWINNVFRAYKIDIVLPSDFDKIKQRYGGIFFEIFDAKSAFFVLTEIGGYLTGEISLWHDIGGTNLSEFKQIITEDIRALKGMSLSDFLDQHPAVDLVITAHRYDQIAREFIAILIKGLTGRLKYPVVRI